MSKIVFLCFIFLVSFTSAAQGRYAYLCSGRHEFNSIDFRTKFYVVVDLNTIREKQSKKYVQAYIKTTPSSRVPKEGINSLIELELLKYEELGNTVYFDVQAHNVLIEEVELTFFTLGMDIPDDGRRIIFSSFVNRIPMDGACKRVNEQDSLWIN